VKGAMQQSFSWEIPAKRYVKLFHQAIKNRERDQKE
jgi:glycogen synthase